jgi:alpha-mannosidase
MSEQDYGVALMNDCKYGHKVYDNMLDLNLLRSPSSPDPDADKAVHHFTYALLPHCGNLLESKVMAEAEQLNQAPVEFAGVKSDNMVLPCRLESDGISLEVLKKAEKEDCLILRMVENQGRHSSGKLYVESGSAKLVETNLMEWTEDAVYDRCGDGSIELKLTPFEIKTFKLKR